jgi:phosphoesterase RecJ-like protein
MNPFKATIAAIQEAENIVITSHKSPDGDSVGSSLALYQFLTAIGKPSVVCHPDEAPLFLTWLPGAHDIVILEKESDRAQNLMMNADLIFCLDYNSPDRTGEQMEKILRQSKAKKIMIDHHLHPDTFCDSMISDTSSCSTAQLIYELIDQGGYLHVLNEKIGTPIYLGIMTDTGSFRYSSVQPRTHEILANLLRNGVSNNEIHEKVFDTNTIDRLQLRSHILAENLEIIDDFPIAILTATNSELHQYKYKKGDADGLVNVALSIEGVQVAVFFVEREDGAVKISFRSKGDFHVNVIAMEHFAGGGHKYAAGGMSSFSLEDTVKHFKQLIPVFFS